MPKRKRDRVLKSVDNESSKRQKQGASAFLALRHTDIHDRAPATPEAHPTASVDHPVLRHYYRTVRTLRSYLVSELAKSGTPRSRARAQRILQLGLQDTSSTQPSHQAGVVFLLDNIIVGLHDDYEVETVDTSDGRRKAAGTNEARRKEFLNFSQQLASISRNDAVEPSARSTQDRYDQADIVDFAIWTLFHKTYKSLVKPPHLLCYGTYRGQSAWRNGSMATTRVPGLVCAQPNEHVEELKAPRWQGLLSLLGQNGDGIMLDLLMEHGMFMSLSGAYNSFYQMSGPALSEMQTLPEPVAISHLKPHTKQLGPVKSRSTNVSSSQLRSNNAIRFVRNRMFYARAAFNAKGEVASGLRHIHVIRRFPDAGNPEHTKHILMYIFPRQFRLHNVFNSATDTSKTGQQLHDYTLREDEIRKQYPKTAKVPRRLSGTALALAKDLQRRHKRCDYKHLLEHYCPVSAVTSQTDSAEDATAGRSLTDLALPAAQVSAFCCGVVHHVWPVEFFGAANTRKLCRFIDCFVRARRFETFSLATAMEGLSVKDVDWMRPSNVATCHALSATDFAKRHELFAELVYYLIDSFIIPLVRANFHVTEASGHHNRIFYFRHDVWRRVSEPALTELKARMYCDVGGEQAYKRLGFGVAVPGTVRLMPKGGGVRPILNLRRRVQITRNGETSLARSTNSALAPAFTVLNFEKLGAALFSVAEILPRLSAFRSSLNGQSQKLYFVKVDVQSCYDNLPQTEVVRLVESLLQSTTYEVSRYAQVKPPDFWASGRSKVARRFQSKALRDTDEDDFAAVLADSGRARDSVFVDNVMRKAVSRRQVVSLLGDHVQNNIVKIGKKYFRQRQGIAQGSVVSSLLCSLVYGDLEQRHLNFLTNSSVLLRLIDDFLLITTDLEHAQRFLNIMHRGIPECGVVVNPKKTLVNFGASVNATKVSRIEPQSLFPYCGILIDQQDLQIHRASPTDSITTVNDALTVEYSQNPGSSMRRKLLANIRVQQKRLLMDTGHNSTSTIARNIFRGLLEVLRRARQYVLCFPRERRSGLWRVLGQSVEEMVMTTLSTLRKGRKATRAKSLSEGAVRWLVGRAVHLTLGGTGLRGLTRAFELHRVEGRELRLLHAATLNAFGQTSAEALS